jgi:CheY-like chemotaxis protein
MEKILTEKPVGQPQLLRVLMVEDRLADVELATHMLRQGGFEVCADVVQDAHGFSERLASESYDVVLADYQLPGWTGMDALVILQELRKDIPFILMSGALEDETAVECIKKGVTPTHGASTGGGRPFPVGIYCGVLG